MGVLSISERLKARVAVSGKASWWHVVWRFAYFKNLSHGCFSNTIQHQLHAMPPRGMQSIKLSWTQWSITDHVKIFIHQMHCYYELNLLDIDAGIIYAIYHNSQKKLDLLVILPIPKAKEQLPISTNLMVI